MALLTIALTSAAYEYVAPRLRGAASPDQLVSTYVSAMVHGDAGAVVRLIRFGREDARTIESRIQRYRSVDPETVEVEYRRHPDADYLLRVRITWRGQLVDELWLERAASPERWVIDHFEAVQ